MSALKAKILEEKDNPLMLRKEYWLVIDHESEPTPSRKDIVKILVKELKSKDELVIIEKMFSEKGKAATRVRVEIYNKKEDIPKHKVEKSARKLAKGKKPEGEEAKPAEEKPTEEKKEKPKGIESKEQPKNPTEEVKEGE